MTRAEQKAIEAMIAHHATRLADLITRVRELERQVEHLWTAQGITSGLARTAARFVMGDDPPAPKPPVERDGNVFKFPGA